MCSYIGIILIKLLYTIFDIHFLFFVHTQELIFIGGVAEQKKKKKKKTMRFLEPKIRSCMYFVTTVSKRAMLVCSADGPYNNTCTYEDVIST